MPVDGWRPCNNFESPTIEVYSPNVKVLAIIITTTTISMWRDDRLTHTTRRVPQTWEHMYYAGQSIINYVQAVQVCCPSACQASLADIALSPHNNSRCSEVVHELRPCSSCSCDWRQGSVSRLNRLHCGTS